MSPDRLLFALSILGSVVIMVVLWLGLRQAVGSAWYPWTDPVMGILLAVMVVTGTLAVILFRSGEEK